MLPDQCLLRLLAQGDVCHHATDAHGPALCIHDHRLVVEHPMHFAIRMANTVLELDPSIIPEAGSSLLNTLAVLRMHSLKPELRLFIEGLGGTTVDLLHSTVDIEDAAAIELGGPDPFPERVEQFLKLGLPRLQIGRRLSQLTDINTDAKHPFDSILPFIHQAAITMQPDRPTTLVPHLHLKGDPLRIAPAQSFNLFLDLTLDSRATPV